MSRKFEERLTLKLDLWDKKSPATMEDLLFSLSLGPRFSSVSGHRLHTRLIIPMKSRWQSRRHWQRYLGHMWRQLRPWRKCTRARYLSSSDCLEVFSHANFDSFFFLSASLLNQLMTLMKQFSGELFCRNSQLRKA